MQKEYRKAFMLLAFVVVVYGVYTFMIGFHNIDLSVNMIIYTDATTDITSYGNIKTYKELYTMGLDQIMFGLTASMIGALFGGILYGTPD